MQQDDVNRWGYDFRGMVREDSLEEVTLEMRGQHRKSSSNSSLLHPVRTGPRSQGRCLTHIC